MQTEHKLPQLAKIKKNQILMNYRNACNFLSSAVTFKKPSFFFSHSSIF